ncbi:MAG: ornithine carbamoyltransferase [Anaerolinea sp.]|nr:ornithine carbamoyltransferase [Anaerolinea sp.]
MRHFIDLCDWSSEDLREILNLALTLKDEWRSGGNRPILQGKALAMIFQKPSLRTRISFEMAMQHLGGHALYIAPDEIGLGKRESVGDVARVLSGYVQGIMARVFAHRDVIDLARYASVPVINGLSDASHPCQALADILTIRERFGRTDGLRIAFVGDGNNVAASLMEAAAHFGIHFTIATPPGYELPEIEVDRAAQIAEKNGVKIEMMHDRMEAVRGADVIYTDTWVSMGQEAETAKRVEVFKAYQVNDELVALAAPDAIVLHCLPAHRGQEITDSVADGEHSAIFQQAENRLHAQKAVLVTLMG